MPTLDNLPANLHPSPIRNPTGNNQYRAAIPMTLAEFYEIKFSFARAMLDAGKTYSDIMRFTGLSKESVARVSKGEIVPPQAAVDRVKSQESSRLTVLSNLALDHVTEKKLAACSVPQLAMTYGIFFDKRQLLDGRPTVIGAIVRPPTELDAEIAMLSAQIVDAEGSITATAEGTSVAD